MSSVVQPWSPATMVAERGRVVEERHLAEVVAHREGPHETVVDEHVGGSVDDELQVGVRHTLDGEGVTSLDLP